MLTTDFDYNLPKERIAFYPPEVRGDTRLMVIDRKSRTIEHGKYQDLDVYMNKNDVLVINNTKVSNMRLFFTRNSKDHEILLLKSLSDNKWECLIGRSSKLNVGDILSSIDDENYKVTIDQKLEDSVWIINSNKDLNEAIDRYGHVPLPPYIKREDQNSDRERYNTIFSKKKGSSAAPTASLNITDTLLKKLKNKGVGIAELTLDVGWGTFSPIRDNNIEDHIIHRERIEISKSSADIINNAKGLGGRLFAVGTTSARTIESVAGISVNNEIKEYSGDTNIYIYPGYEWKAVDALVTNFHAPRTTLLAMIGSFMGVDLMHEAYEIALESKYNFLSYGDSMLIL